uniref:Uncharacterized protein n=1 Tax=Crocodylus porosus TaxID=8502 RepID=A0A7M4FSG1_CROPO
KMHVGTQWLPDRDLPCYLTKQCCSYTCVMFLKTTCMKIYFLDNYISGRLNWTFRVGVCTDGAAAVTGRLSGFMPKVKEAAPECESNHCIIHRKMLAS